METLKKLIYKKQEQVKNGRYSERAKGAIKAEITELQKALNIAINERQILDTVTDNDRAEINKLRSYIYHLEGFLLLATKLHPNILELVINSFTTPEIERLLIIQHTGRDPIINDLEKDTNKKRINLGFKPVDFLNIAAAIDTPQPEHNNNTTTQQQQLNLKTY